ncbi:TcpE family conjugal transfer membrane protein [Streptococcus merionis]|uniref:TcpE family conjugal transfer membrane protein n=1 Tax=Streptococcus merionis TaxID=400065 RepID=UPI0035113114
MELEDKKLYSYKQALSQPYWIQKLNDDFSLPSPVKFSWIVYAAIVGGLLWFLFSFILSFTAIGFRAMLSVMGGFYFAGLLSELVVDGKALVFYLKDYFLFYLKYGSRSDKIYINKGQVYDKPVPILKSRREKNE